MYHMAQLNGSFRDGERQSENLKANLSGAA